MTSQKRKSSLPVTTAKRQKLNEESERPSVASRTRNGVSSKSKSNQCSTQKKKNPKVSANKAIKKSQSSQSEIGRKKKNASLNVTKKSTVKNVPAKEKVLRSAKELTAFKRNTQKAQSRVCKSEARRTSVQNKNSKIIKNSIKTPSLKRIKTECVKKNGFAKIQNKTDLKSIHAKKETKKGKITQNKTDKGDKQVKLNEKSKRQVSRIKQTALNLKKQVPTVKTVGKKTKLDCKKESGKPPHTAPKLSSTRRTRNKPLQQQSVISPLSNKKLSKTKPGSAQIDVSKKILRTRVNKTKAKVQNETSQKIVCINRPVVQTEKAAQSGMVPNGTIKKEIPVNDKSKPCNSSNLMLSKKISIKGKNKAKTVSSTVPLKSKKDRIKPVAKRVSNKVKKQKDVKPECDKNKLATPAEDDPKSKRISILELCNEIAGEIESDTVEVAKEEPCAPNLPTEDKHSPMDVLPPPPAEEIAVNQYKRFFPSRKPSQMKCKPEQKKCPGIKNSKWSKIKLKNNFAQNNVLRNQTVLPNLEMIKAKVSQVRQSVTDSLNSRSSNKKSDATLTTHIKINKTILSERLKNNTLQAMGHKSVSGKPSAENGLLENHIKHELEIALDEGFRLHLDSSPENSPMKKPSVSSSSPQVIPSETQCSDCKQLTDQMAATAERGKAMDKSVTAAKSDPLSSDQSLQKEIRKLKEADKDSVNQPIIDAGQKRFGATSCNVCGMLYTASNPEDETQHLLFHNQFISAVKYVGWKKERIVSEYPDGKIIMVLPDDPKYALKKVEEIREMVDNDLGFQQVPLRLHSRTKTLLFISSDKKVVGCLIAEHIQWGYRVIDDFIPSGSSDKDQVISERVKAWCCSTTPEPAICGVSRIWVFSMMRRKKIASRMLECLRNHFIYGSHLNKDEIAFSDPTPDGKLFATHYCGTSQFLVYNFVSGHQVS
ncbi:N-acetyltransferase ESCO1 [Mixophyes fleayi]|uniref:N-acetyltransferase ESCO1 n=1 Tax=Mixophyes fleayi TaxID=3061075 RepID=UPI003F4D9083